MSWIDDKEKAKKQKKSRILKNNVYMLGKIFRYSPMTVVIYILYGISSGIYGSVGTVMTVYLLNGLDDNRSFSYLCMIVAAAAVTFVGVVAFDRIYYLYLSPKLSQKLHYAMQKELLARSLEADLACFDDPEYYDDFLFAMSNADGRAMGILNNLNDLIRTLIRSTTVFAVIFLVSPIVTVVFLAASIAGAVISVKFNRLWFKISKEENKINRKENYLNRLFFLSDFAKEIRISKAGEMFEEQFDENKEERIRLEKKYRNKKFVLDLLWEMIDNLAVYGVLIYLFILMAKNEIGMGGFSATVVSCWSLLNIFNYLSYVIPQFSLHSLYVEKYRGFVGREPKVKSRTLEAGPLESIVLEHVTFSYKEDQKPILKDISFEMNKGERIAFVGYNGAGKTTLIKLLLRLYDPTEGRILYNGHDLKEYDLKSLRERMGVVFQDYKIFAASIAENVMGGECGEGDRGKVLEALEAVAFTEKLKTLEQGIDTPLTREFDDKGVNLSGGEAQKIAIARVFAKPFDMIVLDEPSSALDPVAEYELNRSLLNHCGEKTVIFISHRLSTTRVADRIYMFDSGSILESGSHDELLLKGGKYAEMFEMQSKNYKTATEEQS